MKETVATADNCAGQSRGGVTHRMEFVDRKMPTVAGLNPPKPVLNLHWMGEMARGKNATEVELCEGVVVAVGEKKLVPKIVTRVPPSGSESDWWMPERVGVGYKRKDLLIIILSFLYHYYST